jgi:hypothetical protein
MSREDAAGNRNYLKECGSGNAECGNYENQIFSPFYFHIPHSEFPIHPEGECTKIVPIEI